MRATLAVLLCACASTAAEELDLQLRWPEGVAPLVTETVVDRGVYVVTRYRVHLRQVDDNLVFERSDFSVVSTDGNEPDPATAARIVATLEKANVPLRLAPDGDLHEELLEELRVDPVRSAVKERPTFGAMELWCAWVCNWLNVPVRTDAIVSVDAGTLEGTPSQLQEYSAIRPLPGQLKLTLSERQGGDNAHAFMLGVAETVAGTKMADQLADVQVVRDISVTTTVIEKTLQPLRSSITDTRTASAHGETREFRKRRTFVFDWGESLP